MTFVRKLFVRVAKSNVRPLQHGLFDGMNSTFLTSTMSSSSSSIGSKMPLVVWRSVVSTATLGHELRRIDRKQLEVWSNLNLFRLKSLNFLASMAVSRIGHGSKQNSKFQEKNEFFQKKNGEIILFDETFFHFLLRGNDGAIVNHDPLRNKCAAKLLSRLKKIWRFNSINAGLLQKHFFNTDRWSIFTF